MNKKILVGIVLVATIALIVRFGISNTPSNINTDINKEPLIAGTIIYPGYGFIYIAKEKGFFNDEGVNVKIVQIPDENQLVSSLASNRVQLLSSTPDFTVLFADAGVDAKQVIATDIGRGSDGIVVTDDIKTMSDLKGKKVHLSLGSPSHFLFRFLGESFGLQSGDVTFVNATADQVGAGFVAEKIDYGVTWEPWLSKSAERKDGRVLLSSADEPGIIVDTWLVRTDAIKNRREDVKAFMRAHISAVEWWRENKVEGNEIIARNFGIESEDINPIMELIQPYDYKQNIKKFSKNSDRNIFELSKKAVDIYTDDEIIASKINIENLIDTSLLEELYK